MGFRRSVHHMHEARMRGFGFGPPFPGGWEAPAATDTAVRAAAAVGGRTYGRPSWHCSSSAPCTDTR
jgi:hypothetical protein